MDQQTTIKNEAFRSKFYMQNDFFCRTMDVFEDKDLNYRPQVGMLSVKGQVLHVVGSLELFVSAYFSKFSHMAEVKHESFRPAELWSGDSQPVIDLAWAERADRTHYEINLSVDDVLDIFTKTMFYIRDLFAMLSLEQLQEPIGENTLVPSYFDGYGVVEMMLDHTAHHRGALAQYARLLGYSPKIPYFDMEEALHEKQVRIGTS
ncbi:DinB family protein [Pseudoalteromonas sp. MMG012]|uniref:DinB family protein n=1 Tax=Pseudoalteromonas sp. MMG012 TaxID=2822686 RepID=UPI001B39F522|nr:DinB family protein [Pseudoalteromonas sp. MMG012]MBQ4849986.1 DinB family protein [Pseudoalteromonas sp. MMG012]